MRTWADVAVLAKSRNLDGRFVARAAAGLPFLLEEGDVVALVPPKLDLPRSATIRHVTLLSDDTAEIQFEEVGDAGTAYEMVGMHCLIKRDLIDIDELLHAPALWEGWPIIDDSLGQIGVLETIVENPGQTLLEVRGPDKSFLIPYVDEIVHTVDFENQSIFVALPKGLLEL